ncbi:MAG: M48 family metallopeptidase [Planctomycetota bacterium]
MDFFEHQDVARRKTGRLVVLMVLAVVCIIALVYGLVLVFEAYALTNRPVVQDEHGLYSPNVPKLHYLKLLGYTTVAVLLVIIGGALYKTHQLSAGGSAVARSLGGRPVPPDTTDLDERKLLNVVEEMSIASGCPVPPVYVLDEEDAINAFAAGWSVDDAVLGFTRGSIEQLSRDELQGVVAHEYSHILNGDMRLNLRLTGLIFGILVISLIGYLCIRSIGRSRGSYRGGRGKDRAKAIVVLLLLGVGLIVVGYVGVFFGRLIQAAVSRQREYLADAAAVQFTRNPDGIANALRRIGGLPVGSKINDAHASEHSHLFFGSAVSNWLGGFFATHPPLTQRIARIDPRWEGEYIVPRRARKDYDSGAMSFVDDAPAPSPEFGYDAEAAARSAVEQIGQPTVAHLQHAHDLIESLPSVLRNAAHTTTGAQALVLALLLDRKSATVRQAQLDGLDADTLGPVAAFAHRLADEALDLDAGLRLPLLDLAIPALGRLDPPTLEDWQAQIDKLIAADGRLDLFEWALRQILWRHLQTPTPGSPGSPARKTPKLKLAACRGEVTLLLSVLARIGARSNAEAGQAFAAAAEHVEVARLEMLPRDRMSMGHLTDAVDRLAELNPDGQRRLIAACAAAVQADSEITPREHELFRAVAETLGVPVPPVLRGQRLV